MLPSPPPPPPLLSTRRATASRRSRTQVNRRLNSRRRRRRRSPPRSSLPMPTRRRKPQLEMEMTEVRIASLALLKPLEPLALQSRGAERSGARPSRRRAIARPSACPSTTRLKRCRRECPSASLRTSPRSASQFSPTSSCSERFARRRVAAVLNTFYRL